MSTVALVEVHHMLWSTWKVYENDEQQLLLNTCLLVLLDNSFGKLLVALISQLGIYTRSIFAQLGYDSVKTRFQGQV